MQADLVLLGGDLFHDNNPSRATLGRAIDIISQKCLDNAPIRIRVLSDHAQNFASG